MPQKTRRQAVLDSHPGGWPSFSVDFRRGENPVGKYGFTFTRATTATYVGADGLIKTAASGELRYDYSTGTCGVLIEDARTNYCLYSHDLTQTGSWTASNVTTAKDQTGPDGTSNSATLLTASAGNGTVLQAITRSSAARITSCYIKRITGTGNVDLTQDNGSTWTTVTVTSSWTRVNVASATAANPTVGIRIVTSGDAVAVWGFQHEEGAFITSVIPTTTASATRNADVLSFTGVAGRTNLIVGSAAPSTQNVTVTATAYTLSQTGTGTITLSGASTAGPLVGAGTLTFTPSAGTLTLTMSGSPANVQLETGSTATAYIPTTNGPRTVENVAPWFNGDAGTWFVNGYVNTGPTTGAIPALSWNDASSANECLFRADTGGAAISYYTIANSVNQTTLSQSGSIAFQQNWKIAGAYEYVGEFARMLSVQGKAVSTQGPPQVAPFKISRIQVGTFSTANYWNGVIYRIQYWPRRLANATLQALTT